MFWKWIALEVSLHKMLNLTFMSAGERGEDEQSEENKTLRFKTREQESE